MNRKEIKTIVTNKLIDVLGIEFDEADRESSNLINDLGMDSLDAIEIIMDFEKEFMIGIPDDDIEKIETVEDIINYLQTKV